MSVAYQCQLLFRVTFTTNPKLKKSGIYSWNLPRLKTCPKAGKCKNYCYVAKGNFVRFPAVREAAERNLKMSYEPGFVNSAILALKTTKKIKVLRIHTSGDFYSQEYLDKWFEIARACPEILFYAYTTSLHLDWKDKPRNFTQIQSMGGQLPVDFSKAHAQVFDTAEELEAAGYINASDNDLIAALGFTKIGLIKH